MVKRKAEYKEGPEARENFEQLAKAVFHGQAEAQRKSGSPRKLPPAKSTARTRAKTVPLLPRPCRRMVERVYFLARQLGIGQALPGDLAMR